MKRFFLLAAVAIAATVAPHANAATILVDNWKIDLAAGGIAGGGKISPIDEVTFRGIAHNNTIDSNGNFLGDIGEFATINGLGSVTSLNGNGSNVSNSGGKVLGTDFELTFQFSVGGVGTGLFPLGTGFVSTFTHTAPGVGGVSGLLDFYLDPAADSVLNLLPGGGTVSGITNGTKIATFEIIAGEGGIVNSFTLDGSDDATFQLISALPGVFLDSADNDLGLLVKGGAQVLIAFTNSNFDLDNDNGGTINSGAPAGWAGFFPGFVPGPLSPVNHFALEDGSLNLSTVPEPASLLAFAAIGFVGFGARRRRQ